MIVEVVRNILIHHIPNQFNVLYNLKIFIHIYLGVVFDPTKDFLFRIEEEDEEGKISVLRPIHTKRMATIKAKIMYPVCQFWLWFFPNAFNLNFLFVEGGSKPDNRKKSLASKVMQGKGSKFDLSRIIYF